MPQILGVGLISVDNLFIVRKGGTFGENSEFEGVSPRDNLPCRYIGSHGGGSASNTLCILSKLGFKTSILGATGKDAAADLVFDEFRKFGVKSNLVVRKDGRTRQFTHLIFGDSHQFYSVCPICHNQFPRAPALNERDRESENEEILSELESSNVLHIDRANSTTLKLVNAAYSMGKLISFDFGFQAYWGDYDIVCEIIKRTTILKASNAATRTFLSRMNKLDFRSINPNLKVCITTKGSRGAEVTYLSDNGVKSVSLSSYEPKQVVDQAGAGDAFQAGLLYGMRDTLRRDSLPIESTINESLRLGGAFASLACTDYGSRGYFLRKLDDPNFESAVLRDVEALERKEYDTPPLDADTLFSTHRSQVLSHGICGVCGQPLSKSERTLYESKIDNSPWSMASSFKAGSNSQPPLVVNENDRMYFVGSGASLSVATFGSMLVNHLGKAFSIPTTPYDYISFSKPGSTAILVSYSGRNPDIISALHRARDIGSDRIHILTGDPESNLAREGRLIANASIHVMPAKVSDSGFVSTQGMLSSVAFLIGLVSKSVDVNIEKLLSFFQLEKLTQIFGEAKKDAATAVGSIWQSFDEMTDRPHIVALGSGWAWPAVVDLESRITEGAVSTIEVSELKNYTHGRYLNAYRNKGSRLFVLFGLPSDQRLVRFLYEKLSRDFPVMTCVSKEDPPVAIVDLLVRELYLSSEISKRLNMDIAKAWHFPKESRGLFSWGPIYSPSSKKLEEFARTEDVKRAAKKYQTKLT